MSWGLFFRCAAAAAWLLVASGSANAARSDVYVPDELQPWVDWVLEDREYLDCPFFFDQRQSSRDAFICAWPGLLSIDATADSGRFSQPWTVYANEEWIPLPGDSSVWPEQVTSNGQPVQVSLQGNRPHVRLGPGRHTLAGRFVWEERPRVLPVPAEAGLLALSVDGEPVLRPERTQTSVWLAERETEARTEDSIEVQIYRLIADDVPMRLVTIFQIDVSGSVREVVLGPVLPEGFVPLTLKSSLPSRLEPNGDLRLQIRPGSWQLRLLARGSGVLNEVTRQAPRTNLPDAEIWSYQSNDRLRVTVPEGLPPVDPAQVSAPDEWAELPAFRAGSGASLEIVEHSRGMVAADNQLTLERELWMDFDGGGFAFSDSIGGLMRSGWRLDMVQPYQLLSATENGQNLLVTLVEEGSSGVELRRRDVDLQALGRSESRGTLPVSGWQAGFEHVSATLNLPPGHKLLSAWGVDRAPGAWLERWKLLDFFLVLIVTVATARLFGKQAGAIALLALTLSWHESNAPHWIWLNLLAAVALVRVAPAGKLRKASVLYRGVSFAALVLVLVPFLAGQLRIGIYPQLEPQREARSESYVLPPVFPAAVDRAGKAATAERERALMQAAPADSVEETVVTGIKAPGSYARYAPNAIVQAGPGKPSWSWNSYSLDFSGPVDPERTLTLLVMPRWLVTALRFIEVLLLLALAALFASEIFNRRLQWPLRTGGALAGLPAVVCCSLLGAGLFAASGTADAQTPSPEILQQLEQRLLEPPPCAPRCAELASADVVAASDEMTIEMQVHALEEVAVPLPGSLQGWRPQVVEIDGASGTVYRKSDQTLWVRVGAGHHRVTLQGPLPPVDSLEVPFPATPRVVTARSDAWSVAGIRERRLLSGALQLARSRSGESSDSPARWNSTRFPVFVRIERSIELDLDWRVNTQVIRVAPDEGLLTLDVPLLDGESIVSGDFQVRNGSVLVSMSPGQNVVSWQSTLLRNSPLSLRSALDAPYKEVWRVAIGSVWRVHFDGVPESEAESPLGDGRIAEFYPRGGETLMLSAERPEPLSGTTLAFDSVDLQTEVGVRSRNVRMTLEYRSTRGAQHVVFLPETAQVLSVTIDGRNEPLRAEEGRLSLPILPGEHDIEVEWRQDEPSGTRTRTPRVDLAAAASNIELGVRLPENRWIIATSGPRLGPGVLYWSELAALVLLAFILGRTRLTPLGTGQWLLLGLGFSTFSWPALILVAAWLLLVGARQRWSGPASWWRFDLLQLFVAAVSIAALAAIVVSVPAGLLGTPDMHIAGNGSWGNSLRWFADRSDTLLPRASAISLPMWVYKMLILAWALWLSFALLRWLPWAWSCFVSGGLWRPRKAAL